MVLMHRYGVWGELALVLRRYRSSIWGDGWRMLDTSLILELAVHLSGAQDQTLAMPRTLYNTRLTTRGCAASASGP